MIWMRSWLPVLRRLRRGDRRGAVAPIIGVSAVALFGMAGLAVDVGHALVVKSALQASTDAAALAGAQLVGTGTAAQAIAEATTYSGVSGGDNAVAAINATMVSGYPMVECLTSIGITCGGPSKANAVVVQQQASVPTMFARVLGFNAFTVTATATASASGGAGGYETPHDVMLVLDTTESMTNPDPNCGISGATRESCALAGVRTILSTLAPSKDQIGLMIFPGLTGTDEVPYEYDCSTSTPGKSAIAMYSAAPVYEITPLASDYRTSDTATTLNPSSDIVLASQGVPSCSAGVSALGGAGTYYADVITEAQSVLTTTGRANTQKVIIFLSDGDASANAKAKPPQISAAEGTNECHAGITAAGAATGAGTWVYSIAYGSPTSGCTTDSPAITPCATMQQIASDTTKFFSDNTTSCTSSASSLVGLLNAYQAIVQTLIPPRLLPAGTT